MDITPIHKKIFYQNYNVGSKGVEVKTILKLVNELINETENQNYEYFNDIDKIIEIKIFMPLQKN